MRRLALWCMLVSFGGCATPKYGNFLDALPYDQVQIADDAVRQIAVLYPPAHTRLELQQPCQDPFGAALVQGLRMRGFAVLEYHPTKAQGTANSSASRPTTEPSDASAPPALTVRYVLDKAGERALYHLTMHLGPQTITRAYQSQSGGFAPASYWARGE